MYSENMQQIYMRTPMPKCDFNNVEHGCSLVNLLHIFRTPFTKSKSGRLLLTETGQFYRLAVFWYSLHNFECSARLKKHKSWNSFYSQDKLHRVTVFYKLGKFKSLRLKKKLLFQKYFLQLLQFLHETFLTKF